MPAAGAEIARGRRALLAQREKHFDAPAPGMAADLVVQLAGRRADLAHVAHDEDAAAGQRGEHIDRRAHRIRIGVVAVVDHRRAAVAPFALQASIDAVEVFEAAHDRRERHVGGQAGCRGGERVACVVLAGHRQLQFRGAERGDQLEPAAETVRMPAAMHVRGRREAEGHDAALAVHGAPEIGMRIVGIDDRDALVGQAGEDLALGAGHRVDRAETREVRALGVIDEGDRGAGETGQIVDLARAVHAHLDDRRMVRRMQLEQRQRHADVVVEVARCRQHRMLAEIRAQDGGAHLLDGGLAIAAGDADQRDVEARAPVGGELAEGQPRVGDADQRQTRMRGGPGGVDERTAGALRQGLCDVVVAVEALAPERDEQHAGDDGARIGADAGELHVAAAMRAVEDQRGGGNRQHDRVPCRCGAANLFSSADFADSRSEKGMRTPAIS